MGKVYKSKIAAAVHETMSDFYEGGLVDKKTMRHFDVQCLTKIVDLSPEEIKEIRDRENLSQTVFAHYLNVSPGTVRQWESGEKRPAGASLKLLLIVKNKGLEAIA